MRAYEGKSVVRKRKISLFFALIVQVVHCTKANFSKLFSVEKGGTQEIVNTTTSAGTSGQESPNSNHETLPSNLPPAFTSTANPDVFENSLTILTVAASDPDQDALSFSIAGGNDAALMSISQNTGVLSFAFAPDFETP